MTKLQAIVFFALGLGLLPLCSFLIATAHSQTTADAITASALRGPYMITPAGDDHNTVWRIDQATGRISYCVRDSNSMDPHYIVTRAPFCSAWSTN